MKKDWKKEKLKKVCQIKPSKKEAKERLENNDKVSFVPMEDLDILTKDFKAEKEKVLEEVYSNYTYFAENDILLAKITPCFENGKLGIANNLKNGIGFGSSEYIVIRSNGEIIPDYLFYFLSKDDFRLKGQKLMKGAVGHKRVPLDYVENTEIPFPISKSEQYRIVKLIDEAFENIDEIKENTEKNMSNAQELLISYLQKVFTNKSNLWKEEKLGDIVEITSSKRIFKKEYVEEGVPFYRTKEIKELAHNKSISTELFITVERYEELKQRFGIPVEGDILLTAIGTIGEVYVVKQDDKFYFKDGNVLWLKNNSLEPTYLKYALMSFVEEIKRLSIGSAYNALPIQKLKEYKIPIPSIEEQKTIVENILELETEVNKLENICKQKLSNLDELKNSILQNAFIGEL